MSAAGNQTMRKLAIAIAFLGCVGLQSQCLAAPWVQQTGKDAATPALVANPVPVEVDNNTVSTYCYSTGYFTPVATPTDVLGVVGSGTKTVKIQKIVLNGIQTTAGSNQWFLIKRSSADTGSTPVAITACPLDSNNAAASAVVQKYTATNPTTGAPVATVASPEVLAPAAATATGGGSTVLFDAKVTGQPIVLRGVAQELDLNFAGAAVPAGLSVDVDVQTTEE